MSYRIVTLDQKSPEWKAWRQGGVGASDAPIILDLSPYMKPHKLWQIKCGLAPEQTMNSFVEERAQKVENAARATLEMEMGVNFPAVCVEDTERPIFRTSLDGFCQNDKDLGTIIMEAKYVGVDKVTGKIPAHHWVQCQYQMAIVGVPDVIYMRSCDGVHFNKDIIKRDDKYIDMMRQEVISFWNLVLDHKEPENKRRPAGWRQSSDPLRQM